MHTINSVHHLMLPVDSADEATSLATYLKSHGVRAVRDGLDAVVCTMNDPAEDRLVHELCGTWKLFWQYSDAELFGVPVFNKNDCCRSDCYCPYCGAGPIIAAYPPRTI